jgi:hypothetical protein
MRAAFAAALTFDGYPDPKAGAVLFESLAAGEGDSSGFWSSSLWLKLKSPIASLERLPE